MGRRELAHGCGGDRGRSVGLIPGPEKVEKAATNALIGNAEEVAAQMLERFHPDDRLMLWFDFFNHDSARVVRNMEMFMSRVAPIVAERVER